MPDDFGQFKSTLEIANGKKIAPQSESIKEASSSVIVVELGHKKPTANSILKADVSADDLQLGNPEHPRLLFLTIESERYQADICGKKRNAIKYRIKSSNGNFSVWQWLDGPKVLIDQPGLNLDVEEIQFRGNVELIDLNDKPENQKVKIFVTFGNGPNPKKVELQYASSSEEEFVEEELVEEAVAAA